MLLLLGSWSVTFSAFQTAEYEMDVWSLMIVCSEDLSAVPVLPTAGTARFSSGLRASDYVTVSPVVELDRRSASRYAPGASAIARAEGLVGHAKAMDARAAAAEVVES